MIWRRCLVAGALDDSVALLQLRQGPTDSVPENSAHEESMRICAAS